MACGSNTPAYERAGGIEELFEGRPRLVALNRSFCRSGAGPPHVRSPVYSVVGVVNGVWKTPLVLQTGSRVKGSPTFVGLFTRMAGLVIRSTALVVVTFENPLEPSCVDGRFDAYTSRAWKRCVKPLDIVVLMFQTTFGNLARNRIKHRDLLYASVKITTSIIIITQLLPSEPWSPITTKSTRSKGADDAIQSTNQAVSRNL